jgi:hypothetical protein
MRARRIIQGAAFGPDVVRTASDALEAAWGEITDRFDDSSKDAAREVLATSIISAVREDSSDSDALRALGMRHGARISRSVRRLGAGAKIRRHRELSGNFRGAQAFQA